jgi:hypothetical protein
MSKRLKFRKLGLPALAISEPDIQTDYAYLSNFFDGGITEEEIRDIVENPGPIFPALIPPPGGIDLNISAYRQSAWGAWGWGIQDPRSSTVKVLAYWDLLTWPSNLTKEQAKSQVSIGITKWGNCTMPSSSRFIRAGTMGHEPPSPLCNSSTGAQLPGFSSTLFSTISVPNGVGQWTIRVLMAGCENLTGNKLTGQNFTGSDLPKCEIIRQVVSQSGLTKVITTHDRFARNSSGDLIPRQRPSPVSPFALEYDPGSNGGFVFSNFINTGSPSASRITDVSLIITSNNQFNGFAYGHPAAGTSTSMEDPM